VKNKKCIKEVNIFRRSPEMRNFTIPREIKIAEEELISDKVCKIKTSGGGKYKTRNCLICDKEFTSIGNGNRICNNCKSERNYIYKGKKGRIQRIKNMEGLLKFLDDDINILGEAM